MKRVCNNCGVIYTEYADGTHHYTKAFQHDKYIECRAKGHDFVDLKRVA